MVGELMPTVEDLVDTSIEAYHQKEANGSLDTDRMQILALIDEFGGVAIWEAAKHLNRPDSDISSRFRDLEKEHIIEKSQTVFKINPRTNKRAHVWVRRRKEASAVSTGSQLTNHTRSRTGKVPPRYQSPREVP